MLADGWADPSLTKVVVNSRSCKLRVDAHFGDLMFPVQENPFGRATQTPAIATETQTLLNHDQHATLGHVE